MTHKLLILMTALVLAGCAGKTRTNNNVNLTEKQSNSQTAFVVEDNKKEQLTNTEDEEKEDIRQTVADYRKARWNNQNLFDNDFLISTRQLFENVYDKNYNQLLTSLECVELPYGLLLDVKCCEREKSGDESKLYVEDSNSQRSYDVFSYLQIKQSPQGAWEAYLLYKLWHILPLWWHAKYASRKYIFDRQDLIEVAVHLDAYDMFEKDKHVRKLLFRIFDVEPRIYRLNNSFYVSCCYWGDWSGLVREYVEVRFDGDKAVGFVEFKYKVLYRYDCQIIY